MMIRKYELLGKQLSNNRGAFVKPLKCKEYFRFLKVNLFDKCTLVLVNVTLLQRNK